MCRLTLFTNINAGSQTEPLLHKSIDLLLENDSRLCLNQSTLLVFMDVAFQSIFEIKSKIAVNSNINVLILASMMINVTSKPPGLQI